MSYQAKITIRNALVSVSDKAGIVQLTKALASFFGTRIVATEGTATMLYAAGVSATSLSSETGFPEILGGRVKTLHPSIHAGLLANTEDSTHNSEMQGRNFKHIDLLIANLYPFAEAVAKGLPYEEIVEHIDIGGVALLRAAAKNHKRVCVVSDPQDYPLLIREMGENRGAISAETRLMLAQRAFRRVMEYDEQIAQWMESQSESDLPTPATPVLRSRLAGSRLSASPAELAEEQTEQTSGEVPYVNFATLEQVASDVPNLEISAPAVLKLRYGENTHQQATAYSSGSGSGILQADQLQGKELSYNNVLDADIALRLAAEFPAEHSPAAVIVKHGVPCGVGKGAQIHNAFEQARECDPTSAYGGIIALNSPINELTARSITRRFFELVVTPGGAPKALEILAEKPNLRVLVVEQMPDASAQHSEVRSVLGGILAQTSDNLSPPYHDTTIVSMKQPTAEEMDAMSFAMVVCKYLKSNAIVIADGSAVLGLGSGQTSRVEAARLAATKAMKKPFSGVRVAASDGFFPKPDSISILESCAVQAIIQPGGSKGDDEVISAANLAGMAMVTSGIRHFRH